MGQTVNLLAYAFGGSNPSLPTKFAEVAGLSPVFRSSEDQIVIERFLSDFCFQGVLILHGTMRLKSTKNFMGPYQPLFIDKNNRPNLIIGCPR